jgi:hypothetical protein
VQGSTYEKDFYGWVEQQSAALRDRDGSRLDWQHLREEIEALGRQEVQELVSRLAMLLGHLLKWTYQPDQRSRSWFLSIREQRRAIRRLLEQNPSLSPKLNDALADGYEGGIDLALRDTALPLRQFPSECPWTPTQTLDPREVFDTSGDWSELGR